MAQGLSFLASLDVIIPNTWPFPEREGEGGRLYDEFYNQVYK